MRTIKIHSRDVARVLEGGASDGFLFSHYAIGESVEGRVRTVNGSVSNAQRQCLVIPMVMYQPTRLAEAEAEWANGFKVVVLDGIYQEYVGFFKVMPII